MDRRLRYYVRDMYLRKKLDIRLVDTKRMRADDKTKVVDKDKFLYCRKLQRRIASRPPRAPRSAVQAEELAVFFW